MLPTAKRLTKKRDFTKLGNEGRSVYGPYATLRVRKMKDLEPRVAFITSTKMFKKAVDRNRTKRRLREVIRELWNEIPKNTQLLFVAKPEAKDADYQLMLTDVRYMLTKIPDALSKPAKPSPRARKLAEKKKTKG